jgi:CheY-like chemotaxis protein
MNSQKRSITILMADDDADDRLLAQEALAESFLLHDLRFVEDGEELMAYLRRQGNYISPDKSPRPELILLDLNMPRKDGREALAEIKTDPKLRQIPIIIFTTSSGVDDIYRSYDLGASSFITKPTSFDALVDMLRSLGEYWFELVELPSTKTV